MSELIEISFRDEGTFRRFVEDQVRRGRVVAPTDLEVELYAQVTLRITAGERSLDVGATVVNPVIPTVGGRAVGLEVELSRAEWTGLEWLLNVLMRERLDAARSDGAAGDSSAPGASDAGARGRVDDTLAREVLADSRFGSPHTPDPAPAMPADAFGESSLPMGLLDTLDADTYADQSGGWKGASNPWLDDSAFGFGTPTGADPGASGHGGASDVTSTFESAGPIANPLRATTDASGRYRADHPARAQAAEAHFERARSALRRGDIDEARARASLAIANNPTESEYADLLDVIERRLLDRSVPGGGSGFGSR